MGQCCCRLSVTVSHIWFTRIHRVSNMQILCINIMYIIPLNVSVLALMDVLWRTQTHRFDVYFTFLVESTCVFLFTAATVSLMMETQLYNHVSLHLRTHDHLWIHFHLISRMLRKRLQGETIELFVNKWKLKNTLLGSWNNRVVIQLMIVNDNQLLRISIQMQCVIFIFIYTSVVFESCWVCILLSVRLQRIIDPLSISRTERQINTHIVRNTRL